MIIKCSPKHRVQVNACFCRLGVKNWYSCLVSQEPKEDKPNMHKTFTKLLKC